MNVQCLCSYTTITFAAYVSFTQCLFYISLSPSLPRDVQAIDSYEAQGDGQVSFEEGDIIQVLDKIEDGKSLFMKKKKRQVGADSLPQKEMWL